MIKYHAEVGYIFLPQVEVLHLVEENQLLILNLLNNLGKYVITNGV